MYNDVHILYTSLKESEKDAFVKTIRVDFPVKMNLNFSSFFIDECFDPLVRDFGIFYTIAHRNLNIIAEYLLIASSNPDMKIISN